MRYKRYRGLWANRMPMSSVANDPVGPILTLAEALRNGSYRPTPPKCISIAKANGERRDIKVYMIRDRVAQRALLQALQARTDQLMSPFSYGYRPGRGVKDAVTQAKAFIDAGLPWVVDADIERCFDAIPRQALLKEVAYRLQDTAASDLVTQYLGWQGDLTEQSIGIPQGSVLAPWLCNIYLWRLDDDMRKQNVSMVRFADDFLLMTATRCMAETVKNQCADLVSTMRLRLNPSKTIVVNAVKPFRFLGQWLRTTNLLAAQPLNPE
ncbi:RNA-directed DNA polymerase [Nitrosomonas cryotolerans]|uniref:Group II intron reverse transcriptase/maturase n=1 Tax=Nitrosomonas cryotolerans ATCC 49181 TaxID=1131553 RepID=A0A1N6JXN6_9PROT|nr:reverse transcriptase/maturase family protein [Nitrosomonas cryotolerans]SFQ11412.1 RNA-directed DNA polymerase [Nitrosomonas cryotolerans]SIO49100.1 group II intron reverse transcriptase/maturase [Nitrosomonas cryotolerans ATCC 49181]